MVGSAGLIPTRADERARLMYALAGELETTFETYDRVVSIEMFEHMRNYETLLGRVAGWLRPGGTLFVHIFTHARYAYPFEVRDESDWMARYFFTGGILPMELRQKMSNLELKGFTSAERS